MKVTRRVKMEVKHSNNPAVEMWFMIDEENVLDDTITLGNEVGKLNPFGERGLFGMPIVIEDGKEKGTARYSVQRLRYIQQGGIRLGRLVMGTTTASREFGFQQREERQPFWKKMTGKFDVSWMSASSQEGGNYARTSLISKDSLPP